MNGELLAKEITSSLGSKTDYSPDEFWEKVSVEIVKHIQTTGKVNLSDGSIV